MTNKQFEVLNTLTRSGWMLHCIGDKQVDSFGIGRTISIQHRGDDTIRGRKWFRIHWSTYESLKRAGWIVGVRWETGNNHIHDITVAGRRAMEAEWDRHTKIDERIRRRRERRGNVPI